METQKQDGQFLDSVSARILALLLAVVTGFLLWTSYAGHFKIMADRQKGEKAELASAEQPAKPANPDLEKCFEKRLGDVDKMKEEGILSQTQYVSFKNRAEQLCRQQNPGS